MHQPDTRRSPDAVRSLLAEGFFEFGSSGRVYDDRQAIIEHLVGEVPEAQPIRTCDYALRILSADVVLRSPIWQHIAGRWQMVFHQGTMAVPRQGEPPSASCPT